MGKESLKNIEVFKTLAQFSGYWQDKEEFLPKRQSLTGISMGVKYHHILEKKRHKKRKTPPRVSVINKLLHYIT